MKTHAQLENNAHKCQPSPKLEKQISIGNAQQILMARLHETLNSHCLHLPIPGVRTKVIQNNKKKNYIPETNCHTHIWFMSSERKTLEVFFFMPAYAYVPAGDLREAQ
jgi:hypothetical protein